MYAVLGVVAVLALLYLGARLYVRWDVWRKLSRAVLRPARCRVAEGDVSADARAMVARPLATLEALGFSPLGWMEAWPQARSKEDRPTAFLALRDPSGTIIAALVPREKEAGAGFASLLADGTRRETNGSLAWISLLDEDPGYRCEVSEALDVVGILADHRRAIGDRAVPGASTAAELAAESQKNAEARWEANVSSGRVLRRGDDTWGWELTRLRRLLGELVAGVWRANALRSERRRYAQLQEQARAAGQTDPYQFVMARRDRRGNRLALATLGTAIFGPLVLGAQWQMLSFLGIAMLVHELGHQLAARLQGQRPPHLFLAAFFGARPVGAGTTPVRQFVILMMGAWTALAIGGLLLWRVIASAPLEPSLWQRGLAAGLLVMGLLPLLPFPFTDGARVLDEVLFPRAPRLSFRLQIAASVLLILVAAAAIFVLFIAMTVVLVFSVLRPSRVARLRQAALQDPAHPVDSPERALQLVVDAGFGKLGFEARCDLAARVLARPPEPARPLRRLALAVVYLLMLLAGPAIALAIPMLM